MKRPLLIAGVVILLDQVIKIWIKTNLAYGEHINVFGDYFQLFFIENNGMAFGTELFGGGKFGKLFLTVFRLFAVCGIGYYIYRLSKDKASKYLIVAMSLIMAGAMGNIIDSVLYGKLFSASYANEVAVLFPANGGYEDWLYGRVVDMFYFTGKWPSWVPYVGGEMIFPPIWNLADAAITIGVAVIILFYRQIFGKNKNAEEEATMAQEV